MSLRIAFDLDGVLADMESELERQSTILFGEPASRRSADADAAEHGEAAASEPVDEVPHAAAAVPPPAPRLNLTSRQQRQLWRHVVSIDNFWEGLLEIEPGAIERLAAIANERRWEVIFLTKRPGSAGFTAQVQSQRWLETGGFKLPSVFVVQGSRGRIAAALDLDIVVDDRPENCLDVVTDSKAKAILVWRDADREAPATTRRLGIDVVTSVAECLQLILRLESSTRGNVVSRVMRLLGLKESAPL